MNLDKHYPILIQCGNYFTHVGQSGNDGPDETYRTPSISIEEHFDYIFSEIFQVNPSDFRVVIIKDAFTPNKVLKEEANVLFNRLNVKALRFIISQKGIATNWLTRGSESLIIDIGYNRTRIVPIIKMMVENKDSAIIDWGSKVIEDYIIKQLIQRGNEKTIIEKYKDKIVPNLMKNYFYFDIEPDNDYEGKVIERRRESHNQSDFVIKDKERNSITLDLPNPILPTNLIIGNLKGNDINGFIFSKEVLKNLTIILDKFGKLFHSYFKTEADPYAYWWLGKVLLTGGGSQISGLRSLLIKELLSSEKFTKCHKQHRKAQSPFIDVQFKDTVFTIHNTPPEPMYDGWIGCSIISSLKFFEKTFITRGMYKSNPNYVLSLEDKEMWSEILNFEY